MGWCTDASKGTAQPAPHDPRHSRAVCTRVRGAWNGGGASSQELSAGRTIKAATFAVAQAGAATQNSLDLHRAWGRGDDHPGHLQPTAARPAVRADAQREVNVVPQVPAPHSRTALLKRSGTNQTCSTVHLLADCRKGPTGPASSPASLFRNGQFVASINSSVATKSSGWQVQGSNPATQDATS